MRLIPAIAHYSYSHLQLANSNQPNTQSQSNPMKSSIILFLALVLLPSCSWFARPPKRESTLQQSLQREGITPFSPPSGNPNNATDMNKYGPGAVVDSCRNTSKGTFYSSANTFWNDGGQAVQMAMNPAQHTALQFPNKIELKRGADGSFGGTMIANQASSIAADAGLIKADTVIVTLDNVRKSQPFGVEVMTKMGKPVKSGYTRILAPVFAENISYDFRSSTSGGGGASIAVSPEIQGKLQAKGYSISNSSLVSTGPVFLGFYPVQNCP